MRNRAFASSERFVAFLCAGLAVIVSGAFAPAAAAPSVPPTLISVSAGSTRAVALESVSMKAEPFSLSSAGNFSPSDPRTRITLFVMNLDLLAGETLNSVTIDAEDAAHVHYPMKVEYVGQVPNFEGIYMVVMRLNDLMTANLGDVLIRLNLHGNGSNRVRVAIGQIGGGPSDDPGAVGTPAPQTPPAQSTPLTIAQYRSLFSDPAMAAGSDAVRFLEQTTWGPKDADLTHLRSVGMQTYLNEQFNTQPQFVDAPTNLSSNYPATLLYPVTAPNPCDANCVRDNYSLYPLQKQFMTNALSQPDQLRQRVSFALHKLIVIAGRDLNNNETSWYAPYLQTLDRNAFGNFRTLLFDITLNPGMGRYLDMAGNSKAAPNENYSREVMQLFSIGTDMLNPDGTPILDTNGNRVPAYSQAEITGFARVFTGWVIANTTANTFSGLSVPDYIRPMTFSNNTAANGPFDIGAKTLLNGQNLPACSNCTGNVANMTAYKNAELSAAIDNLFNHQNTGPYVCTQLIHQLVTSNPSPPYVGRCAAVFANNGSGARGDMKAIITAILLDPEARGDAKTDPSYGRLREPVQLITNLVRLFGSTSDGVLVTNSPGSFSSPLGQDVFNPPTVFSYFPADFGLPGTDLFGPEFGILDTSTTYQRNNFVNTLFLANNGNGIAINGANRPTGTQLNYAAYQALSTTPSSLVDKLNTDMMHSVMSSSMRTSIINAVTAITNANATTQALQRTQTAIYLVATSSQYQVER